MTEIHAVGDELGPVPKKVPENSGNAIPANLARLRLDRGLTQAALAEKAGLSRVAVGQIERGDVLPRMRTLLDLARALGATLGDLVTPVRRLRSARFRAPARLHGREQILAEVSKWLDAYRMLEADLEEAREFGFEALCARPGRRDPAATARAARKTAGLRPEAPIPGMCQLLETNGVKVLLMDKKRKSFFGLSVGSEDGGPAVVVNTWDRISVERWIFTAAHELGHLLLHADEYDTERTEHPKEAEEEADAFASEFLMPESAFARAWDATAQQPLLARVLRVKRIFGVSYQSVLYRLVATGRKEKTVWGHFQVQHRRRFGRTLGRTDEPEALEKSAFAWDWRRADEPAALSEHDFLGDRLRYLVRRALEEDLISMGRAAEILGMRLVQTREWVLEWAK